MMKKTYAALTMVLLCLLPFLSACEDDVTSTYNYMVVAAYYSPNDPETEKIARAIVAYQTKKGLLDKPFKESVKKEHLTDQEREELDKKAGERAMIRLSDMDFARIVRDAGITVSETQPTVTIEYRIGYPTTDGGLISAHSLLLQITPDRLK